MAVAFGELQPLAPEEVGSVQHQRNRARGPEDRGLRLSVPCVENLYLVRRGEVPKRRRGDDPGLEERQPSWGVRLWNRWAR